MRVVKRILLVLFALAIVGAIVYASLPKPIEVELAVVERGPLQVTVNGDGRTRVQDRYVILAPLYGNLGRIELEPGDDMKDGAILARISPLQPPLIDARSRAGLQARVSAADAAQRQAEAAAARAVESAAFAERELERMQRLTKEGALAPRALDAAELERQHSAKQVESADFGVRVARHELEMARAALGMGRPRGEQSFELSAPVGGRVLRIMRESEGVVNPGEPLLEIGDPNALEIVVDVLTVDAVDVEIGDPVIIDRWGGDAELHGSVRNIEPSAFTKLSALGVEEQRVNVIIAITEASDLWKGLGDGYRVETRIVVWESDAALKVPAGALHRHGEQWALFVVEAGMVHERSVELGHRSGLEVEILSGVEPGQSVVLHPSDRVDDGVEVVARG